jgi:4-diphosphocytidyl-2-C-methyl-D-erythritol kinase
VVEKRNDGYHNLETVFFPLPFTDALELITDSTILQSEFSVSGLPIAGEPNSNLCLKALSLLQERYPLLPAVRMHLHKNIPMGAGLGGGSSDGAFTLMLLNKHYALGLSDQELAAFAIRLGSDCPFFIYNKPVFATGRGEILEPLKLDLSDYSFLIVNPGLHISTAGAFSKIKPGPAKINLRSVVSKPINNWKANITNDFEQAAISCYPELATLKSWLYNNGAIYASMTGSGSAFYGIFPKNQLPATQPDHNWSTHPIV